jgi:hypothetical protein
MSHFFILIIRSLLFKAPSHFLNKLFIVYLVKNINFNLLIIVNLVDWINIEIFIPIVWRYY